MNYYNDFDKHSAAWLRELVKQGHLPPGDVDDRSIKDVRPEDLKDYTQCHFFAGIGGWSLALRLAAWPADRPVWTGSCPCQPFSSAGKGKGTDDPRHLWPDFCALIAECNPPIVFGEQVASKAGRLWFSGVRTDLEALGYGVGAADIGAAGLGAPHIRQRLWWVAQSSSNGVGDIAGQARGQGREAVDARPQGLRRGNGETVRDNTETRGASGGVADTVRQGPPPEQDRREQHPDRHANTVSAPSTGSGVGDTLQPGLPQRECDGRVQQKEVGAPQGQAVERTSDGVVDPALPKSTRQRQQRQHVHGQAVDESWKGRHEAWADCEYIPCADGKARPIKPGLAPLVNGLPGRVGLLRGYGNAIVPQVAAEFIMAYIETTPSPAPEQGE